MKKITQNVCYFALLFISFSLVDYVQEKEINWQINIVMAIVVLAINHVIGIFLNKGEV